MWCLCCSVYLIFGFLSASPLPFFMFFSSSQIKLVGGYFIHKQQQGFSSPVSNEGELVFPYQKLFSLPCSHRELSVMPTMCCLWYLLPFKWVKERQLVFPHGFSLQTFRIAGPAEEATARGSRGRVQLDCLHDKSRLYLYRQRPTQLEILLLWLAVGAVPVSKF